MNWTDDFSFFLNPVSEEMIRYVQTNDKSMLGNQLDIHSSTNWPSLEGVHLIIIGVDPASTQTKGASSGPDEVRKKLYQLHLHNRNIKVADLGNLTQGETPADTHLAIQKVIGALALRKTMAIILGGTQELTFSNYAAYEVLESTVNIAIVDSRIDMGEYRDELSSSNYLSKIVIHKPSYLFNVSIIGYQTYLNDPETIDLIDKLFFDALRLGEIRKDIKVLEPHLRQADIVSIDMNALSNAAAPGTAQPNGLNGEEICQLSRYAGLSDNCSTMGIYNYDPDKDVYGQTALLIAQMIWHAMEGLGSRIREYPLMNKPDFFEYKVQLPETSEHLTFFKSKKTEKWWMNVPYTTAAGQSLVRHHLIPCNYSDYETAATGEMPDLWWRTYRKLT